jgi:hypothetical protein
MYRNQCLNDTDSYNCEWVGEKCVDVSCNVGTRESCEVYPQCAWVANEMNGGVCSIRDCNLHISVDWNSYDVCIAQEWCDFSVSNGCQMYVVYSGDCGEIGRIECENNKTRCVWKESGCEEIPKFGNKSSFLIAVVIVVVVVMVIVIIISVIIIVILVRRRRRQRTEEKLRKKRKIEEMVETYRELQETGIDTKYY